MSVVADGDQTMVEFRVAGTVLAAFIGGVAVDGTGVGPEGVIGVDEAGHGVLGDPVLHVVLPRFVLLVQVDFVGAFSSGGVADPGGRCGAA